jgi:hypothetical protein
LKKQGSFFITLIDCIFKRDLIVISHQTSKIFQQTTNTTAQSGVSIWDTKQVGTFISPKQIFIIMGLSDCAANKSFIFKPF